MKLDSESETNSPIEGTVIQRAYCTSIHDLEKIEVEQTKIDHEPFDIPFWILFRINVTDEGKNMPQNLSIEYVYSLPGYKTHYYLDQTIVEKELMRCFDLISKRVQTILLLNQVE